MRLTTIHFLFALTALSAANAADPTERPPWETELQTYLELVVDAFDVPGAAVVVATDDGADTVLTAGVRCLGEADPVAAGTSFGIASLTKAFTGTAAAALVGDGALDWDTRARELIPELELADPVATELVTLRDLLAHRSGLGDHYLILVNSDAPPASILPRLALVEPAADFRARHVYSSLGYTLAGEMIGRAAGSSWAEVVSARLLEPLGMSSTTIGHPDDPYADVACGHHRWRGSVTIVDPLALGTGAAGNGLYSTASDMARWLGLLLGNGVVDGRTVVETAALEETWMPQAAIRLANGDLLASGLGWNISHWRGRRLIIHRGGGVGFTSQVRVLPSDGLAVAVLTNRSVSGVPDLICERVSELLLDEEIDSDLLDMATRITARVEALQDARGSSLLATADPDAPPSLDLSEYAGCYRHPAFGELELVSVDDGLAALFHGLDLEVEHLHHDVFMLSGVYTGEVEASFTVTDGVAVSADLPLGSPERARTFAREPPGCR